MNIPSKLKPMCCVIAAAGALSAPGLQAQDNAIEEILVTGSKIRQDPLDRAAPINTISTEDMDRSGLTSIADLLQRLPNSGGALNTRFNSSGNFGFPPDGSGIGAGAAQADLRHLGSKRVLVLVDGVRWVNGSSASGVSSATDLNTIPNSIIERIEVLEDGASAIYGSDAIAGVINIITKKNYEGFEASAYSGAFDKGDGETQEYALSWGTGNEDTSMFFSISYNDQQSVSAADRAQAAFPSAGLTTCDNSCSSGTPQGRFYLTDPNTGTGLDLTINDGVGGIPSYDPTNPGGGGDDFHGFTTADRFNYSPYNLVMAPVERWGFFNQIQHKFTDNLRLNVKALYNNRQSTNQAAPEPIFIGPEAGNGNLMDTISVDVTNPYNPFGFTLDAATNPYFIGRRPLEGGPRVFNQDVDTFYASAGLDGNFELGSHNWYWDATIASSRNHATQIKTGGYNSRHIQLALGPVDVCASLPGCVPLNIFGGQGANGEGSITSEMLDWISFVQKDESEQKQFNVVANLSGTIVDLPAGPLGVAVGYEYRELEGSFQPDAVVAAGESAGVPSSPTSGEFDVTDYFVEFNVPLLADIPGADLLALSLAARTSDYSTFGSDTTGKVALRWKPVEDVLLRASWAEGIRAPGIGELYNVKARLDAVITDPCSDLSAGSDPNLIANCDALGIPVDGSYTQFNQQISVTTAGNPDLNQETSESTMWGIVYSPSWVDNANWVDSLSLEINYFDIEVDDAIQVIPAQLALDSCVYDLDMSFCENIGRTATGTINYFFSQLTNIGGIETSGYDVVLTYASPDFDIGQFNLTWSNNFLSEYNEILPTDDGTLTNKLAGKEVGDPESSYPEWKSTVALNWNKGPWSAAWTMRYIDAVEELQADNEMDATMYNDMQVSWTPANTNLTATLGVNNLFDEDSPECYSCALNGFDATTYDVPGQFVYLRLNYRSN